jgi:DNA-binding CsgD family transcriptional regulator
MAPWRLDAESHAPVLSEALESVLAVRGHADKLMAVVERAPIPMTMHDDARQHVEANWPAQLMARSSLAELRALTVDDFMPPDERPIMDAIWTRMLDTGLAVGRGPRVLTGRNGRPMDLVIWGMANALPGLHLFACAPSHWETGASANGIVKLPGSRLTPRELEVLQLAAEGLSSADIADMLMLSRHTIKTHFENAYRKLDAPGRVGAVAKALRLGLVE